LSAEPKGRTPKDVSPQDQENGGVKSQKRGEEQQGEEKKRRAGGEVRDKQELQRNDTVWLKAR